MSQSKSFPCPGLLFPELITSTQSWLSGEGFTCQKLQTEDGGGLLQIEKVGGWRKFVGMSTALNIVFHQVENTVNVEIGAGRWMDKATTGAAGELADACPLSLGQRIVIWEIPCIKPALRKRRRKSKPLSMSEGTPCDYI